jgi:hypothetical protein
MEQENNAKVSVVEATSAKNNKPYSMAVITVGGIEVFRKFLTPLEIVAIKTLIK